MKPGWRGQYLRYKAYLLNTATQYKKRDDIRAYLEILLSLATVSVFAVFALRPTLLTIAELVKEIESKKETIAVMDQKIDDLTKARGVYNFQKDNVLILKSAIPDEPAADQLLRQIEGLSSKHQSTILEVTIDNAFVVGSGTSTKKGRKSKETKPLPGGTNSLSLLVGATGDYLSLANFVKDLEYMRRPVIIDSLIFSQKIDKQDISKLTLTIGGRVPYIAKTDSTTNTPQR